MSVSEYRQDGIRKTLLVPKPLPLVLRELLVLLDVQQTELAEAAQMSPSTLSRIINEKLTPSPDILGRIRLALIEAFGIPEDLITLEYLITCRDYDPNEMLPSQFARINAWLQQQPEATQRNFWSHIDLFMQTVEDERG